MATSMTSTNDAVGASPGCTLARLAEAKRLDVDFLASLGLRDGRWTQDGREAPAVVIPYLDTGGEHLRDRYRIAVGGDDRFRWGPGRGTNLYGLWRLADMTKLGWVLLVEGESDCWTGWWYGLPLLGVPGARGWKPEWAALLDGLEVCAWQEPDQAGEAFVRSIASSLPALKAMRPACGLS
jgi:hypothetical protein